MKKGRSFLEEFKTFILRGNVMDMAVGVIIGGAFTAIVTSLNTDILTPIIGLFGGTDFSYLKVALGSGKNAPMLTYGNFITAVINFLITSFIIFCLVKAINKAADTASALRKKEEEEVLPTEKECPYCFSKINIKATRCPHCTSELDK
ncbi:MAG: large conductance mechanosensitive channel protein MscL [Lachnospiraceae bacterium]|nr:large conductance mechanosensitive channel protein MscL [Lachnospiraceae bacterium]